ncbi:hypothetical protein [Archangium lipolyticum]|uniref:hypothetical protein n=1 Tax=Archangium lipolyticum TaxID=2970465 RepID=UPI00214A299E|nr:hypothetical protein [Archangium lipolyticum]
MTSFQDAFHKGLEAYESADRARKEIFAVFDDCAKQVSAASGGAISLSYREKSRERRGNKTIADVVTGVLPTYESYEALEARIADGTQSGAVELCEYKLSPRGYPVSIAYADVHEYCHDKPSLEQALVDLLGHPVTGGVLRQLMDLQAKTRSGGAGGHPQVTDVRNGKGD